MTKEQLQKLIDDGDIHPFINDEKLGRTCIDFSDSVVHSKAFEITFEGQLYTIGTEIEKIIEINFFFQMEYQLQIKMLEFKNVMYDTIKFSSKDEKIELQDILNNKVQSLKILRVNPFLMRFNYELRYGRKFSIREMMIIEDARGQWMKAVKDRIWWILKELKYGIFGGRKIDAAYSIDYLVSYLGVAYIFSDLVYEFELYETPRCLVKSDSLSELSENAFFYLEQLYSTIFGNVVLLRQIEYLKKQIEKLMDTGGNEKSDSKIENKEVKKKRAETINAPEIAIFCLLINEISTVNDSLKMGITENQQDYCRRVCEDFHLKYTDNVRQCFGKNGNYNDNLVHIEKIKKLILPNINKSIREKIEENLRYKRLYS